MEFYSNSFLQIISGALIIIAFRYLFFRVFSRKAYLLFILFTVLLVIGFVYFPQIQLLVFLSFVVYLIFDKMQNKPTYTPPEAVFEGGGIKRGLTAPEAAVLLGKPFDKILALVLLGMSEKGFIQIRRGSLLHDIGKMGIPDDILNKPGKLSADERKVMQKHPQYAFEMLSRIDFLKLALEIPFSHHEKWDGSGYPRGIKGDEIPFSARIFAIIDVLDAMINDRPYRDAIPKEEVLNYIKSESGKHFDPDVVKALFEMKSFSAKK